MKQRLASTLKPIAVIMMLAVMIVSSCTANGKLRKPPSPPNPAGVPKPPTP